MPKVIGLLAIVVAIVLVAASGSGRNPVHSITDTVADAPEPPRMDDQEISLLSTAPLVADQGRIASPAVGEETDFAFGRLPPADLAGTNHSLKIRRLERRLLSEAVDPDWAGPLESELYAAIADIGLPISYVVAECKTSICRIDVIANVRGLTENGGSFRELVTRRAHSRRPE